MGHTVMMTLTSYLRIVKASAGYDLLVTWPFVTPWTFVWVYTQLNDLAVLLGLPGTLSSLNPTLILFANLMGSVVVVWSLARIFTPSRRLGLLDGLARVLFALWQFMAFIAGANAIVLFFTAVGLLFALLQFWPVASETSRALETQGE